MKRFLIVVLVISAMLSAAFVDQTAAKKAAENYYKNYAPASAKGNGVTNIFAHEYEGQVTWYGVSFDQGFVLVTADDGLKPILGYSFTGKLADPSKRDGGLAFKEWFGYMDKQVLVARKYSYVDAAAQTEWKNIQNNSFPKASKNIMVDALVKTKWDQVWPWNDLCPEKDGTWTYVGCVATAASMIMRYHEWPPTGTGSNTNSSAGTTETYSNYNFDYTVMNHVVDVQWGLYPTYWETVDMDAAAIQNMAELNYLTGHSFDMSYGTTADGGSGANMSASSTAFQAHWFYNTGYATVGTPTDPTYIASTIQGELDAKRPWWWAGGVHSFILDGYTDDYWYHFNWGWGGSQDGWFQITFLVPDGTGSGGGDGDYTASQIRISCLPNTDPFTAWPAPNSFNGSLANAEDVQLTWSAPTGGGQDSYNVFKSVNGDEATLLTNTTGTSYDDNDLVEGDYSYYVTAVYSDGESHNTDSYSTTVAPSLDYPVVRGLVCEAVGRTNIDLTWTDPFTGVILETTGFEDGGAFPAGWTIKTSSLLIKGDPKPPSFFADDTNGWVMITSKAVNPHIVLRPGEYCLIVSSAHTANCWILSPLLSLGPDTFIKFWTRFKGNPDTEQYPRFHIVEQTGVFDGRDSYANILSTYDADPASPEYVPWNDFEAEWEVPLSGLAGLDRCIGFEIEPSNNYYTMAFDDVLIGEYSGGVSGDPDGYEVYRNGSLATTISDFTVTNWSDTNFIDGQNDYYIRAMYPSGESLAKWTSATIDANPVPNDLTGVGSKGSADLSWYMPYHNAPKWYSYITPESCSSTVDDLDGPIVRRRTQFKAEDLGFYYPITLDSVAIGFYDWDEGNWGGDNTFTIRILTGGTSAWDDTVYTSGTLTAVHNEIFTHPLPTPMVLNESWNVEITTTASGFPGTLASLVKGRTHSYFWETTELSYSYGMWNGVDWFEWLHMSYVHSSAPDPIAKDGWVTPSEALPIKGMLVDRPNVIMEPIASSKAIDYYKIHRDGSEIGTSTTLNYSDGSVPADGTYNYYVTAYYANPLGESVPSNDIDLFVTAGGIQPPTVTSTGVSGGNLDVTWDAVAGATGYVIYSSTDPYGTFSIADTVGTTSWSTPTTAAKMFYYIIATDAKTVVPETIEVEAQHK